MEVSGESLLQAVKSGIKERVLKILRDPRFLKSHLNFKDEKEGATPLKWAINKNLPDITKILIKEGADIDSVNEYGETPLMEACWNNMYDVTQILLHKGANVNMRDKTKSTALINASCKGHTDICGLLIERNVFLDSRDDDGCTSLLLAIMELNSMDPIIDERTRLPEAPQEDLSMFSDVAKLLINAGASVNCNNNRGRTPLTESCRCGSLEITRMLLEKGAIINARDDDGNFPLLNAVSKGHYDVCNLLVEQGANLNIRDEHGCTPLLVSLMKDTSSPSRKFGERGPMRIYQTIFRLLVNAHADVNIADTSGLTPLIEASCEGMLSSCALLLEAGADIDAVDESGDSALISAASRGKLDVCKLLVNRGASLDIRNKLGFDALKSAQDCRHLKVVKYLTTISKKIESNTAAGMSAAPLPAPISDQDPSMPMTSSMDISMNEGEEEEEEEGYPEPPAEVVEEEETEPDLQIIEDSPGSDSDLQILHQVLHSVEGSVAKALAGNILLSASPSDERGHGRAGGEASGPSTATDATVTATDGKNTLLLRLPADSFYDMSHALCLRPHLLQRYQDLAAESLEGDEERLWLDLASDANISKRSRSQSKFLDRNGASPPLLLPPSSSSSSSSLISGAALEGGTLPVATVTELHNKIQSLRQFSKKLLDDVPYFTYDDVVTFMRHQKLGHSPVKGDGQTEGGGLYRTAYEIALIILQQLSRLRINTTTATTTTSTTDSTTAATTTATTTSPSVRTVPGSFFLFWQQLLEFCETFAPAAQRGTEGQDTKAIQIQSRESVIAPTSASAIIDRDSNVSTDPSHYHSHSLGISSASNPSCYRPYKEKIFYISEELQIPYFNLEGDGPLSSLQLKSLMGFLNTLHDGDEPPPVTTTGRSSSSQKTPYYQRDAVDISIFLSKLSDSRFSEESATLELSIGPRHQDCLLSFTKFKFHLSLLDGFAAISEYMLTCAKTTESRQTSGSGSGNYKSVSRLLSSVPEYVAEMFSSKRDPPPASLHLPLPLLPANTEDRIQAIHKKLQQGLSAAEPPDDAVGVRKSLSRKPSKRGISDNNSSSVFSGLAAAATTSSSTSSSGDGDRKRSRLEQSLEVISEIHATTALFTSSTSEGIISSTVSNNTKESSSPPVSLSEIQGSSGYRVFHDQDSNSNSNSNSNSISFSEVNNDNSNSNMNNNSEVEEDVENDDDDCFDSILPTLLMEVSNDGDDGDSVLEQNNITTVTTTVPANGNSPDLPPRAPALPLTSLAVVAEREGVIPIDNASLDKLGGCAALIDLSFDSDAESQ